MYGNDAVRLTEERNAKEENPFALKQQEQDIDKITKILMQTENSDTYKRKDGLNEILIYPSPVNIKINGKWMKIDDYLKQPEEMLENKAEAGQQYQMNPFEVYAGTDENNKNILKTDKNGNYISFSLEEISYKDKKKETVLSEAEVGDIVHSYKSSIFKNIFQGVDLKYHATRNGIKEELFFNDSEILKNIEEPDYFGGKIILKTKINISAGILPEMRDGLIYFKKDGQIVFSTSKPYIYDQEKRTTIVESNLTQENGVYYFESTIDYGWMTSEDKVYPLVLDPDLNLNPVADVSLCSESTCATNGGTGMTFIKFDISSIPSARILQSASLILTHSTYLSATISAQRFINQTWNESSALSVFTGGSFGSILSTITSGANVTETWNVLGDSGDGLVKDYNDHNTYYSIYLDNVGTSFTPAYVQNTTTLVMYYYYVSGGKQTAGTSDLYFSREGTTPPVLKVTYADPFCGDGICNGSETHATCPQDNCPQSSNDPNSTVFDYSNHPSGAKSIIDAPGTTGSIFRNQ